MTSKKRSAREKQVAAFKEQLGAAFDADSMEDVFAREERRRADAAVERDAARRNRACESKNRYASRAEAEEAIASCAAYGRRGLHSYRCDYCGGWHLTSKPERR